MSFSRCVNAFPEKNASEASSPKSPLNPLFRGKKPRKALIRKICEISYGEKSSCSLKNTPHGK